MTASAVTGTFTATRSDFTATRCIASLLAGPTTPSAFHFPDAGIYDARLIFYEGAAEPRWRCTPPKAIAPPTATPAPGAWWATRPTAACPPAMRAGPRSRAWPTPRAVIADWTRQWWVAEGDCPDRQLSQYRRRRAFHRRPDLPGSDDRHRYRRFRHRGQVNHLHPHRRTWSFGVNSDDGFGLTITGHGQTFTSSVPGLRGPHRSS